MDPTDAMADDTVIRVRGLAKCYEIYARPQDRLKQLVVPPLARAVGRQAAQYYREFWALRDVDFSVRRGECIGIIGRNGAGKSTLLQLICGTLNPTTGSVETRGRVAALLELGAGFNPEFTGRENVFLNGALLGLDHDEMLGRFDEIAAFADIGDFIEQPVKTYSSGMYVRLAFAVQACVEPDILIVDEALAVGDIGFQYKCYQHMQRLRERGVTILMVTHATGSVLEYANRCIVIDGGRIAHDTTNVLEAVLAYEKGMRLAPPPAPATAADARRFSVEDLQSRRDAGRNAALDERRFGSARAIIDSVAVHSAAGHTGDGYALVRAGDEVTFTLHVLASERIDDVVLGVSLSLIKGNDVWGDNNLHAGERIDLAAGATTVEYRVRLPLSSGEYLVHCGLARIAAGEREELDQRRPLAQVRVWSAREQVGVVFAPISVSVHAGSAE